MELSPLIQDDSFLLVSMEQNLSKLGFESILESHEGNVTMIYVAFYRLKAAVAPRMMKNPIKVETFLLLPISLIAELKSQRETEDMIATHG